MNTFSTKDYLNFNASHMTHAVVSIEGCHNAAVSKIYSLQNVGTQFCGSGFDRETDEKQKSRLAADFGLVLSKMNNKAGIR